MNRWSLWKVTSGKQISTEEKAKITPKLPLQRHALPGLPTASLPATSERCLHPNTLPVQRRVRARHLPAEAETAGDPAQAPRVCQLTAAPHSDPLAWNPQTHLALELSK